MTKLKEVFYGVALALILVGAVTIEAAPRVAFGVILGAGLCIFIADWR